MRFAICPLHLSKVLRLPRKSDARSYEVLHLSPKPKVILGNVRSDAPKCNLSREISAHLRISLMSMSLVLRLPRDMHLSRSSSNVPCLPSFLDMLQKPPRFAHFWQCTQSLAPAAPDDIWTSKSGPRPSFFNTFDFETCFAPQRRALFRHLNFQKCFGASVLCTFWLRHVHRATTACTFSTSQLCSHLGAPCAFWLPNVLRATTVCTFSTSQLPKVLWTWCVLHILTSKCASRHNGVCLFLSHLATWLRTRRFGEPTSWPSGATNHWKNTMFCDFGTFSRTCIFCLLTLSLLWSSLFFSSLTLPTSAFPSVLSEVWRLNFLRLILVTIITHCESHLI